MFPGAHPKSSTNNYWHHFRVTAPALRRLRFSIHDDMSTRFYASRDGRRWFGLPATAVPGENGARYAVEVSLAPRRGLLHIANAPVYPKICH